jgi:hypothetical protein
MCERAALKRIAFCTLDCDKTLVHVYRYIPSVDGPVLNDNSSVNREYVRQVATRRACSTIRTFLVNFINLNQYF